MKEGNARLSKRYNTKLHKPSPDYEEQEQAQQALLKQSTEEQLLHDEVSKSIGTIPKQEQTSAESASGALKPSPRIGGLEKYGCIPYERFVEDPRQSQCQIINEITMDWPPKSWFAFELE